MDVASTPLELRSLILRGPPGPQVLDVRRAAAFEAAENGLPDAVRRAPETVADWVPELESTGRSWPTACTGTR
jgi:rhodanese-related sulfurtransferase